MRIEVTAEEREIITRVLERVQRAYGTRRGPGRLTRPTAIAWLSGAMEIQLGSMNDWEIDAVWMEMEEGEGS